MFLQLFYLRNSKTASVFIDTMIGSAKNFCIFLQVPRGTKRGKSKIPFKNYVSNPEHEKAIAEMTLTHAVSDFCVLGAKGSGKTTVVEEFGRRLGYHMSTLTLYQVWRACLCNLQVLITVTSNS